jgi:hypothetical protein
MSDFDIDYEYLISSKMSHMPAYPPSIAAATSNMMDVMAKIWCGELVQATLFSGLPGFFSKCFLCLNLQLNSLSWKSLCLIPAQCCDLFLVAKGRISHTYSSV